MRISSLKILFVGETWLGSCARSLREALARHPTVELDELAEDAFFPKGRSLSLRLVNRLVGPLYRREFNRRVLEKVRQNQPDFLMAYKGNFVHADLLQAVAAFGVKTVNVYPDYSPHAFGKIHREAVGKYDLVISTKVYHPDLWHKVYRYNNRCVFVPQGYDPQLHLASEPPTNFEYDVVLIATYRPEYGRLMTDFAAGLAESQLKVAIGGYGWDAVKSQLPDNWLLTGPVQGRGYIRFLRSGKICLAPLNRQVMIDGQRQPGDVDTTRTYELAAAHCFFIHQRTDFVRGLYEAVDLPFFSNGRELAVQVLHYLNDPDGRLRIARAAHKRAVPTFSTDARANAIEEILRAELVGTVKEEQP